MPKMTIIIITVALFGLCASCAAPDQPTPSNETFGEQTGRTNYPLAVDNCDFTSTIDSSPRRAVSLNQSATEILLRLDLADRMVGTAYETDPVPADIAESFSQVPLLASGVLKHESLLAAQPDFVYSSFASFFSADNAGERSELENLGVGTYLTEFDCTYHASVEGGATFEMLLEEIRRIAEIFDVEDRGEALIAEQQRVLDEGASMADKITGTPSMVWFYSTAASSATPSVAGPGGLPQAVTEMIGGRNVFDDASTKWPEVSWDEVAARNPDVIVLADLTRGYPGDTAEEKIAFLEADPLTSQIDAVKNRRFVVVPGQYMDPSIHSVHAVPAVAQGIIDTENK